ncbi:MAG: glutamine--fructose-6-phosphate transaminase (isomerizing) [Dehalococcoidia bacterium]|nr:glutamine--fructose-6-phosphate transaminase (isomerizing) [Dehalococcoidia bacterium]
MCGIIGYTGRRPAGPIVIEGLKRLEYRGYDSAGIALLDRGHELYVVKVAGKLDNLDARIEGTMPPAVSGIGHTRWATHGVPSEANAHPMLDPSGRVAVVHNGIVENFEALRERFYERGERFASDTDTEVIAHLLAEQLAAGVDLAEAMRLVTHELAGAHAILAICRDEPDRLVAARVGNAGGLVIGYGEGEHFVSSDLAALLPHTSRVAFLDPGEIADVRAESVRYVDAAGRPVDKTPELQPYDPVAAVKGRYKHFMLKEIHEQPDAVLDALRGRYVPDPPRVELERFPLAPERIRALRRVVLVGMGTSLHAAMVGRHYIERLARIPAEADNAAEFRYRAPVLDAQTLVISVAQSGETVDTLSAMDEARRAGCPQVTICNTPGSQATRVADAALFIRVGPEIAVASTKTLAGSMVVLHALALYLGRVRGTLDPARGAAQVEAALHLPSAIGETLLLEPRIEQVATRFAHYADFLYLGRGVSYPMALEGALKLKEVAYIHAEGYPAAEMKHGPIALIDERMPTVAIALDDGLRDKMRSTIEELKARRGPVIALVTEGDHSLDGVADEVIALPRVDPLLTPLVTVVVMQLLAYHIAVQRGCDVDQPRNLAKTVTVE